MEQVKKKVLTILVVMLVMAFLFSLPGFAETQQELKDRFVTREEWSKWINDDCGVTNASHNPIGMSEYIANIEQAKVISVYNRVATEMSLRGMKLQTEESTS